MAFSSFMHITPGMEVWYIKDDSILSFLVVDIDKLDNKIWVELTDEIMCIDDFDYNMSSNGFFYPSLLAAQTALYKMKCQKLII